MRILRSCEIFTTKCEMFENNSKFIKKSGVEVMSYFRALDFMAHSMPYCVDLVNIRKLD
jgi:hypothetical protein